MGVALSHGQHKAIASCQMSSGRAKTSWRPTLEAALHCRRSTVNTVSRCHEEPQAQAHMLSSNGIQAEAKLCCGFLTLLGSLSALGGLQSLQTESDSPAAAKLLEAELGQRLGCLSRSKRPNRPVQRLIGLTNCLRSSSPTGKLAVPLCRCRPLLKSRPARACLLRIEQPPFLSAPPSGDQCSHDMVTYKSKRPVSPLLEGRSL